MPIFVLEHIQRGQDLPIVNAVVFAVIVLTVIPVAISVRLTRDTGCSADDEGPQRLSGARPTEPGSAGRKARPSRGAGAEIGSC
jgi:hypothetical protein